MAEEEKKETIPEEPEDKMYEYNGKMIKPILIKNDMEPEMRARAYELAFESLSKYTAEKEMSEFIKGNFDREFEPEWQCVIGKDFSEIGRASCRERV